MSWRGMDGGIESAKAGHDVIMCPTSHCYFDYYQANPETSPEAFGGYTTLKKVSSFDPVPPELSNKEAKFIPSKETPALANAKIGIIPKAT